MVLESSSEDEGIPPRADLGLNRKKRGGEVIVLDDSEDENPRIRRMHRMARRNRSALNNIRGRENSTALSRTGDLGTATNLRAVHRPPWHEDYLHPPTTTNASLGTSHTAHGRQAPALPFYTQDQAGGPTENLFQLRDPVAQPLFDRHPSNTAFMGNQLGLMSDELENDELERNRLPTEPYPESPITAPAYHNLLSPSASNNSDPVDQQLLDPSMAPEYLDEVLRRVTELFPDICPDHVRTLFNEHFYESSLEELVETVINEIADAGEKYPRRKREMSKKADDDVDQEWSNAEREPLSKVDHLFA